MRALQVQAAMESAASAANSRVTSLAPSRAHSPDHLTHRQSHSDLSGQASDTVADSESVDVPTIDEGGNNAEQDHRSRSPSPDGRAGNLQLVQFLTRGGHVMDTVSSAWGACRDAAYAFRCTHWWTDIWAPESV